MPPRALILALALAPAVASAATLERLRVERLDAPLVVDTAKPRFGWVIHAEKDGTAQQGYRLQVSHAGKSVWDSGEVRSAQSFDVPYGGPALAPGERYDWRVDVHTSEGAANATATFETAPDEAGWGGAQWIGKPDAASLPAPLLRRAFHVEGKVARATLYVAAGGYADMRLDGHLVSDAVLSPGFTDYAKRVEVVATDLTLAPGDHELGAELGRGFYGMTNPNVWHWERAPWHGQPRVRAVLVIRYADGHIERIPTDTRWEFADGPTQLDDLYGGETFDARAVSPSHWAPAAILPAPSGRLVAQIEPPIRVTEVLTATEVTEPKPGVFVFAFPRVIAGWADFDVEGPAGTTISAHYGEKLLPDGTVDARDEHHYFKHGFQTDRLILGEGRTRWHPRFSYKGFRYVQVDGWPGKPSIGAVKADVVHTDVAVTGRFDSSNDLLNWIHRATVDTLLNNLHGIPTDTPMYEKNGWTGDGMLGADMFLRNFDAGALFTKWERDIADTRGADGAPLVTAPNAGWALDVHAPTWHSAYVLVPWSVYMATGDRAPIDEHLDGMARYVAMEHARSPGGIANTELGDWVSPETDPSGENAPEDKRVAATAYLYRMERMVAGMQRLAGNAAEARRFDNMADSVRTAFNARFFDREHAVYRGEGDQGYRQAHNLLALGFGLVPDDLRARVAAGVAADARARGDHLDTGALATKLILPVLTATGHADEAWAIATQVTFPSWGFWRANGATSLWEHWKLASRSRGHYFLGTVDDWLFEDVAGLRSLAPGWRRIGIRPALTAWLAHASAAVMTPYGEASVAWRKAGGKVEVELQVPVGVEAEVGLPGQKATVVGSGHHRLTLP